MDGKKNTSFYNQNIPVKNCNRSNQLDKVRRDSVNSLYSRKVSPRERFRLDQSVEQNGHSSCPKISSNFSPGGAYLNPHVVEFVTSIINMATENINFKDKVVLVTGSSNGMGLAMATRFSKLGAKVVVHGRDERKMAEAAQQCTAASPCGYKPLQVKADMTKDADLVNMVNKIIATYGKLDILVNNAGVIALSPIDDPDLMKKFDNQMNINVRAPTFLCALCTPHLEKSKGNIVNISSGIGMRAVTIF